MHADPRRIRLAAVAIAGGFAGWALYKNGGAPVFPLDDAYIHLQYARGWAQGHPLVYQPGEAPGTGATSLLWPILLAPVAALGPDPMWAAWLWCLALGTLGFALAADGTYRYLRAEDPDDVRRARAGAIFVLGFGPLAWTVVSGMEGALAAGVLAQALAALRAGPWAPAGGALRGGDPPAPGRIPAWAWACVLATLRPEGAVLVGLIAVGDVLRAYRTPGPDALRARWTWVFPLVLGAVQPVLNLALTGGLVGTSGLSKASRTAWAYETFPVTVLWREFVLGGWGDHLAQGFGPLLAVAILAGVARAPRRDGGLVLVACWLVPMMLLAVSLPIAWHHYRYLHLLAPVVAMLVADVVAWGLGRCGEAARPAALVLAACWSLGGAAWADLLARNVADIRMQHVAAGRWVAAHLPPDARIAAGDVGALAWFGGRRLIDLEGIVTPGMLRHAAQGEGSLYARLRALRPTHAVYYGDDWYPGIGASGAFVEDRRVVLVDRSIAGAHAMLIGTAKPAVFDSAATPPRLEAGESVCARIDLADIDSEAAGGWEELPGTRPLGAPAHPVATRVVTLAAPFGDATLVDDARRVFGAEVFRLPCGSTRGGRLVARVAHANARSTLLVGIGGRAVGRIVLSPSPTRWIEVSLALPEDYAGEELAVVPEDDTPGDAGGRLVARWWRVVGGASSP